LCGPASVLALFVAVRESCATTGLSRIRPTAGPPRLLIPRPAGAAAGPVQSRSTGPRVLILWWFRSSRRVSPTRADVFFAAYLVQKRDLLALGQPPVLGIDLPSAVSRPRWWWPGDALLVLVRGRRPGTSLLFFASLGDAFTCPTAHVLAAESAFARFMAGRTWPTWSSGPVQQRVAIWLHPFKYRNDEGYQIVSRCSGLSPGPVSAPGSAAAGRTPCVRPPDFTSPRSVRTRPVRPGRDPRLYALMVTRASGPR